MAKKKIIKKKTSLPAVTSKIVEHKLSKFIPVDKKTSIEPKPPEPQSPQPSAYDILRQEIWTAYKDNPLAWGKYYFPHHFRSCSPPFHMSIIKECLNNRYVAIQAPRESAKAQSLDSKVLTKYGWMRVGDLHVGDKILRPNGKETTIVKLHPISQMELYRVTFRGGASTLCNLDHLWKVQCPSNTKKKVLVKPLRDILKNYKTPRYDHRFKTHYTECRYYLNPVKPIEFEEKELTVDPYTLGVWLGDGSSRDSRVTSIDPEMIDYIPYETKKHNKCINYGITMLAPKLRKINVLNNKHIPREYLFGSIKQRVELFQGLIDTDGHISKKKSAIEFTNKNKQLIDGIIHLAQSLGGRTHIRDNITYCNGKKFKSWKVHIWLPPNIVPCKLKRKLANWNFDCNMKLYLENIEYEKTDLGRCITIANPDGMYVTDSFLPTHNSTIAAFLYVIHCIAFKKKRHIVILQNTFKKAKETLNTIKNEFKENHALKKEFRVKISRDAEGDSILSHPDGFKIRLFCTGYEQMGSVRGEKFGAYRPDLILLDDLEDDDMVRNPERRQNLMDNFDDAIVPAKDTETGQIIAIGTILHDDCLMAKLVSLDYYKEYKKLFYVALYKGRETGVEKSLWPQKWSVKDLKDIQRDKPSKFAKEYQGDPVSGSLRNFDKKDFRYWHVEEGYYILFDDNRKIVSKGLLADCRASIGCDFAWEEKKGSDFCVAMPVYITPNSDILVDDYFCERGVRPNQLEEILFMMERKLRDTTGKMVYIGMEKAKIEKVMKWFMKQAMRRRNHFLTIKDIPWVHDKISRMVIPLQPRYKMHTIYHKIGMGELEYQLMRIPSGTHDDLPDALQVGVRCLEYAPTTKQEPERPEDYDPHFEWLRKTTIKSKKPKTGTPFVFGKKTSWKSNRIPAKISWR